MGPGSSKKKSLKSSPDKKPQSKLPIMSRSLQFPNSNQNGPDHNNAGNMFQPIPPAPAVKFHDKAPAHIARGQKDLAQPPA
jgi:hypothetical protein